MLDVPGIGERGARSLSRQTLAEVIEPRVEELYSLVQQVLRESGFEELLSSGLVLTGGSAVMRGMVELGEPLLKDAIGLGPGGLFVDGGHLGQKMGELELFRLLTGTVAVDVADGQNISELTGQRRVDGPHAAASD